MKISDIIAWLTKAKRYFSTRPTNGEDSAHWSNVMNSEMCDKIASRIDRLDSHNSELLEVNTRYLLRARTAEQLLAEIHAQTRITNGARRTKWPSYPSALWYKIAEHLKTPWL